MNKGALCSLIFCKERVTIMNEKAECLIDAMIAVVRFIEYAKTNRHQLFDLDSVLNDFMLLSMVIEWINRNKDNLDKYILRYYIERGYRSSPLIEIEVSEKLGDSEDIMHLVRLYFLDVKPSEESIREAMEVVLDENHPKRKILNEWDEYNYSGMCDVILSYLE